MAFDGLCGVVLVWVLWLVFFPRSFGKEMRSMWTKIKDDRDSAQEPR